MEKCERFWSDKKINFSNESVKNPTIYNLLFIIAIYSLRNVNKPSPEMKISTKIVFLQ